MKTLKKGKELKETEALKDLTPSGTKKRESWTTVDKNFFFEALFECGKDFEGMQSLMASKSKKVDARHKSKEQIRHFYYRTWHKISQYITCADESKKQDLELKGLICYGELRRRVPLQFNEKLGRKLDELVQRGSTMLKAKGRRVSIKVPYCRALKKSCNAVKSMPLPSSLTIQLTPRTNASWAFIQSISQNPCIHASIPINTSLLSLMQHLNKKWDLEKLGWHLELYPLPEDHKKKEQANNNNNDNNNNDNNINNNIDNSEGKESVVTAEEDLDCANDAFVHEGNDGGVVGFKGISNKLKGDEDEEEEEEEDGGGDSNNEEKNNLENKEKFDGLKDKRDDGCVGGDSGKVEGSSGVLGGDGGKVEGAEVGCIDKVTMDNADSIMMSRLYVLHHHSATINMQYNILSEDVEDSVGSRLLKLVQVVLEEFVPPTKKDPPSSKESFRVPEKTPLRNQPQQPTPSNKNIVSAELLNQLPLFQSGLQKKSDAILQRRSKKRTAHTHMHKQAKILPKNDVTTTCTSLITMEPSELKPSVRRIIPITLQPNINDKQEEQSGSKIITSAEVFMVPEKSDDNNNNNNFNNNNINNSNSDDTNNSNSINANSTSNSSITSIINTTMTSVDASDVLKKILFNNSSIHPSAPSIHPSTSMQASTNENSIFFNPHSRSFHDFFVDSNHSRLDVETHLQNMLNESSLDYASKFADIANLISSHLPPQ